MNLIISFSGREKGNSDRIAEYIASAGDQILHFRDLDIHPCAGCGYECFSGECKYRHDDVYGLYSKMVSCDRVILIVPMYCGNPCSLYFIFNERCQDYFMHNETYEKILERLYIIGIYGKDETSPDFIPCLEKWFEGSGHKNRVLGIQRHLYDKKLRDDILEVPEVRADIDGFLNR